MNGGEGAEKSVDTRVAPVATPIFDALLTELELEWPCAADYDPDAPNAWFEPAIPPDPADVTDPLR